MALAFLYLILFQLAGELVREVFKLPIPGPVIGMFLLAAVLGWRLHANPENAISKPLGTLADGLIANLGLLFVPAGVGIISEAGLLREDWLPIVVGLVGSTILGVAATGLVVHWTMRPPKNNAGPANPAPTHATE